MKHFKDPRLSNFSYLNGFQQPDKGSVFTYGKGPEWTSLGTRLRTLPSTPVFRSLSDPLGDLSGAWVRLDSRTSTGPYVSGGHVEWREDISRSGLYRCTRWDTEIPDLSGRHVVYVRT